MPHTTEKSGEPRQNCAGAMVGLQGGPGRRITLNASNAVVDHPLAWAVERSEVFHRN